MRSRWNRLQVGTRLAAFLAMAVVACGTTAYAQTFPVNFDPGNYSGRYLVPGVGFVTGPVTANLAPGFHFIDNGTSVGGSGFQIDVDGSGNVTSLNTDAAVGAGNTLTFNNTDVQVDPLSYLGRYFLTPFAFTPFFGSNTFTLIPGLTYAIDNGTVVGGSSFQFAVDGAGNVTSLNTDAAVGAGTTLTFNNTNVVVDPSDHTGVFFLSSFAFTPFVGSQTFLLIPGLRYAVDNGAVIGGATFQFDVDGSGSVTSLNAGAAQGDANALAFNCVSVTVDPTTLTGTYKVNQDTFSGLSDITLIPTLVNRVHVGAAFADITADQSQVTPASPTIGGHQFFFTANGACNEPPTADAGPDEAIRFLNEVVQLDGSNSFDDNTASEDLLYSWVLTAPPSSAASLDDPMSDMPSFVVDVPGTYLAQLVVIDEDGAVSVPDEVISSSNNLAPTAVAGDEQLVIVGTTVYLDGSGSTDPETDPLTYDWTFSAVPAGSSAMLGGPMTVNPTFVPDLEGLYVVELVVSDPLGPGAPDTVDITATTAEFQIVSACDTITALDPSQVTTEGNRRALCNHLGQAVRALQKNKLATAIDKLEKSIARTDGCALSGAPDGNGPGRDWITDCTAQAEVYDALVLVLDSLTP